MAAVKVVMTGQYVLLMMFLYFQRLFLEFSRPVATKLSHMLRSECSTGMKNWVRNFKPSRLKFGAQNNKIVEQILDNFQLDGE